MSYGFKQVNRFIVNISRLLWICLFGVCILETNAQYSLNGSAVSLGDDCYAVTPNIPWQTGSVWYDEPLNLTQPFDIELIISFGFADDPGADGAVFVLQNIGPNALGNAGGGMGYEGFAPSLGVEFDTFYNSNVGDPVFDHVAVVKNGVIDHNSPDNLAGPVQATTLNPNIEDGQDHYVRITWEPSINLLQVYFDCELRLSLNYNITFGIFGGNPQVTFGFTAGTGGMFNEHRVCLSENILGLEPEYAICSGESVQLDVNGGENGVYSWSPAIGLSDANIPNPLASPLVTTTYTVSYANFCGEIITDETTVVVTSPEIILPQDLALCEGESLNLEIESLPDYTYLWSDGTEGVSNTVLPGESYTVTASLGDCSVEDSFVVELLELPVLELGENVELCEGEVQVLQATLGDYAYFWTTQETSAQISISEPGTYAVVITDNSSGCTAEDEITISVEQYPEAVLPSYLSLCEGESALLTAAEAESYSWNNGADVQSLLVEQSGWFVVEAFNGNCGIVDSCLVEVLEHPDPDLGPDLSICEGDTAYLSLQNAEGWDISWPGFGNQNSIAVTESGVYTVLVEDLLSGCAGNDQIEIAVRPLPQIDVYSDLVFCEGEKMVVKADVLDADSIWWNDVPSGPEIDVDIPGIYTIVAANNCGQDSVSVNVLVESCFCNVWVPNAFTPNNDGVNDFIKVALDCDAYDYFFSLYNRWGELLFYSENPDDVWNGGLDRGDYYLQNDVYIWQLQFKSLLPEGIKAFQYEGHISLLR
jgi:gliding motility-associated-like protein